MKKWFIFLVLQLFFITQLVSAQECDEFFGIEKVWLMRNDVQNELNLTNEQFMAKERINAKYHVIFNKKLAELGEEVDALYKLSNSDDCSKEKVNTIVKNFKTKEAELFEINNNYEKEIKYFLTFKQKIKYSFLKFQGKLLLKRQLKLYIKQAKAQVKV